MNERTISSAQTFSMKFLFTPIWILVVGTGVLGLFLGAFHTDLTTTRPDWKWWFLVIWICGIPAICWGSLHLKRVRILNDAIYVSNYIKEVRIPLDEIVDVAQNRWVNLQVNALRPVTIRFRSITAFGRQIMFMPKRRLIEDWTHPIVSELRQLAHLPLP